jgi:hypothetical protein
VKHAPEMPDCRDLSQAHRVVADGLRFDDSVPLINHDNVIIQKCIIFAGGEYGKDHRARYIEAGQVSKIVIFLH